MEEKEIVQTAEDLYITFTIGRPRNERESEFASLVFRLLKINDFMKNDKIFSFISKSNILLIVTYMVWY